MRPVGRPKKTLADLPNNWQLSLLEMGAEGKFDMDAKVFLGLSNDLFDRFMEEEPEFSETIFKMRQISETWWSSIARKSFQQGTSKNINSNLFSLVMRNAYKKNWNEAQTKVDITSNGKEIEGTKKYEIEIIKKTIEDNE